MIDPHEVHGALGRHLLLDGFDFVLDLERSRGARIVDARDGATYLDMFSMYASLPLGMNHPGLTDDDGFRRQLLTAAINKPSNSDVYTAELAEFVMTFQRVLGDPDLPELFLIEGGAAAVENALKAAFDWKQQHNAAAGRDPDLGTKVLHLTSAFHGRSGYTLSLTNTEPVKIERYPKFDWPRISTPAARFPLEQHRGEVVALEERALEDARRAFAAHPNDIACFIAEPILAEGGDLHLRAEFLQAIQDLCLEHDALLIVDEVQTGGGVTGSAWAYQQLGLQPDLVAFGKKLQVCGVMGGRRMAEVRDNVFRVPSRINSTWGGNLVDMVRCRRILEIVESEALIDRAAVVGKHLVQRLEEVQAAQPELVSNARGRGLLAAFDLPSSELRDRALRHLIGEERVVLLGCGARTVRFRPALTVTEDELDEACAAVDRVLADLAGAR